MSEEQKTMSTLVTTVLVSTIIGQLAIHFVGNLLTGDQTLEDKILEKLETFATKAELETLDDRVKFYEARMSSKIESTDLDVRRVDGRVIRLEERVKFSN